MTAVPTTPKGLRTRGQLLDAAREVFAEKGFVNTRMADIAERGGMSMGGLYRYFENKESIFEALVIDIHEELFSSSRAPGVKFEDDPYAALHAANLGYLSHYYENRDVMRTLIEASTFDPKFRDIWWNMRNRHVERFVSLVRDKMGITHLDGIDVLGATEAMACMVEQAAYVWFAHEERQKRTMSLEEAAEITTRTWFRLFFPTDGRAKN